MAGFFLFLATVFLSWSVKNQTAPYILSDFESLPQVEAIMILGASVKQNKFLSAMYQDRADTALDIFAKGKAEKILISGDNQQDNYSEVEAAKNYLLQEGIEENCLLLDYAGLNTYDSMFRAKENFNLNSLIIVTQAFHLPRAIFIARQMGIEAVGFPADRRSYLAIEKNQARETLANVKALLDLKLKTRPKIID
jgi:SanA protein